MTMVVGVIISWIATACGRGQEQRHPDFFSPPVSTCMRQDRDETNIVSVIDILTKN